MTSIVCAIVLVAWSGWVLAQTHPTSPPSRLPALPQQRLPLLLLSIALFTTHASPQSENDMSRMATVQSLVESGSFVIDRTNFVETSDKVFVNGHFYSDKPPMPAILGAAVYLPLYQMGITLHEGRSLAYYLITLMTVKIFWFFGTLAFFQTLKFTGLDAEKRLLAALILGAGSLFFSWSGTFNNHELAGAFLSIGFYFLLKARYEASRARNVGFAGFFLSLAGTADMPTGVFYALFLLYSVRDRDLRPAIPFYVGSLALTILPALSINYAIHGSIVPVQIVSSYFEYPGSYWLTSSQKLSGTGLNDPGFVVEYAAQALLGPNGFLIYNPFLLIALWGLIRELHPARPFLYEAIVVCLGSFALMAYYFLTTSNYGGWSYSVRWFVPLLPFLFFFLYPYLATYQDKHPNVFRAVFCVSIIIAIVGSINPWSHTDDHSAFIYNILEFKRDLDAAMNHWLPQ